MPPVIVVTPVLNGSKYVRETLGSIQAQTDGDWIHYLVDGGSVDGTLEILQDAVKGDSRRRLLAGRDKGLYDAMFKGFERADADGFNDPRTICVWLNSDDLLMPWAFATLRQHFDTTGAEWIASLPCLWNGEGHLEIVQPFNWYPRRLIRAGQFNNLILGSLQQESIFFTRSLLSRLPAESVDRIRATRLAGDFLLWREFARYAELLPIMTVTGGFRLHGANLSSLQSEKYFNEIAAAGVRLPPSWLGRVMRVGFRQVASLKSGATFRRTWLNFQQRSGL